MALSMEEQRLLSEIASRLSADDPKLAERLNRFGRQAEHPRRSVRLIAAIVIASVLIATGVAAGIAIAVS
jgi:hypothetical protein